MHRRRFLLGMGLLPLGSLASKTNMMFELSDLELVAANLGPSDKMPVLFVGHGNPMNAISKNKFSDGWAQVAKKLPRPAAILCISAHWLTRGTSVTVTEQPKTIHDFGGFPEALFKVQYPAPGSSEGAKLARQAVTSTVIGEDKEWGLDHGAWSVLMHMYPDASVPVFQLSIDYSRPPEYHYELGKQLAILRRRGILVVASGNVVHNLGMVSWNDRSTQYDWAHEFDNMVKKSVESANDRPLLEYEKLGALAQLAHPTNDHYLPLLYAAALREKSDAFEFFNDSFDLGSISMRSVIYH